MTPEPIPFATTYAGLAVTAPNPYLATYRIDGRLVGITAGRVEQTTDDLRTRSIVSPGDWQAAGDLNSDGIEDRAVELVYRPEPATVSYYVTVILGDGRGGGMVTEALPFGGDIRIEELRIEGGVLAVRYLARRPGEAPGITPSQRLVVWLRVVEGQLVPADPPEPLPEATPRVIVVNGRGATLPAFDASSGGDPAMPVEPAPVPGP